MHPHALIHRQSNINALTRCCGCRRWTSNKVGHIGCQPQSSLLEPFRLDLSSIPTGNSDQRRLRTQSPKRHPLQVQAVGRRLLITLDCGHKLMRSRHKLLKSGVLPRYIRCMECTIS